MHLQPRAVNPAAAPTAWGIDPPSALSQLAPPSSGVRSDAPSEWQWRLQRRCALSPRQFAGCLGCVVALSVVLAIFFWSLGAPLISGFLAVQVLIVTAAFAFHALHAADGELLRVETGRLLLEGRDGLKQYQDSLELSSLRVGEDAQGLIELRARGRCVKVGRHAQAVRRRQVLSELRQFVLRAPWQRDGQA